MKKKIILAAVTLSMALSAAACSKEEAASPTIATESAEATDTETSESAETTAAVATESAEATTAEVSESAETTESTTGEVAGDTADASTEEPELTMVKFIQIKEGMTLEEVNEILGFEGELTAETASTKTCEWINGTRKVSISFIDNKADTISQVGLDNERGWISG